MGDILYYCSYVCFMIPLPTRMILYHWCQESFFNQASNQSHMKLQTWLFFLSHHLCCLVSELLCFCSIRTTYSMWFGNIGYDLIIRITKNQSRWSWNTRMFFVPQKKVFDRSDCGQTSEVKNAWMILFWRLLRGTSGIPQKLSVAAKCAVIFFALLLYSISFLNYRIVQWFFFFTMTYTSLSVTVSWLCFWMNYSLFYMSVRSMDKGGGSY